MEIERLVRLVAEGVLTAVDLANPEADKLFRFRRVLKGELISSMNRTRNFAMMQLRDELRRQGVQ